MTPRLKEHLQLQQRLPEQALEPLRLSVKLPKTAGNPAGMAEMLNRVGGAHIEFDEHEQGSEGCELALREHRSSNTTAPTDACILYRIGYAQTLAEMPRTGTGRRVRRFWQATGLLPIRR